MNFSENPNFRIDNQHYEDVSSLQFQLVSPSDPDYEQAVRIYNPDDSLAPAEVESKARERVAEKSWWMTEYWNKKGLPKEQVSIQIGEQTIELYNFGVELTAGQILELQEIMGKLTGSKAMAKLAGLKYILIDDTDVIDKKTNQRRRGYAYPEMKAIGLNPRAVSNEPHRIPNVSSFAGTLTHETGHIFAYGDVDFMQNWKRNFDWENLPDEEVHMAGDMTVFEKNTKPDRLISSYAGFNPEEDVCESLAGAVNNPQVLDPERLNFLQERWLAADTQTARPAIGITKKTGDEIELPKTTQPVKYKTYTGRRIRLGTMVKGK